MGRSVNPYKAQIVHDSRPRPRAIGRRCSVGVVLAGIHGLLWQTTVLATWIQGPARVPEILSKMSYPLYDYYWLTVCICLGLGIARRVFFGVWDLYGPAVAVVGYLVFLLQTVA